MRIVVINGMPRSGKDTFVGMCQEIIGEKRCLNVSTVDFVKEVAAYCGWDKTKTPPQIELSFGFERFAHPME